MDRLGIVQHQFSAIFSELDETEKEEQKMLCSTCNHEGDKVEFDNDPGWCPAKGFFYRRPTCPKCGSDNVDTEYLK